MKKRYIALFAIIVVLAYLKIKSNEQLPETELPQNNHLTIIKSDHIESAQTKWHNQPTQKKNEEPKKSYLSKTEFEKIQSEITYYFKQSEKNLSRIIQSKDKVEISFAKNEQDIKNIDSFLYNLNVSLTANGEYRAFFNKDTEQIEIQKLDDFLTNLSEKIITKSKNITNVKLEYETPLENKAMNCVTGEEWEIQKKLHEENNCRTNSSSLIEIRNVIAAFYKGATLNKNLPRVQSEILPLWDEIYGKSEDLRLGNQNLFLCYPASNTIWMEIGCNFKLKIIQKKEGPHSGSIQR